MIHSFKIQPIYFHLSIIFILAQGLFYRLSGPLIQPWDDILNWYLALSGSFYALLWWLKKPSPFLLTLFGALLSQMIPIYYFVTDSVIFNLALSDITQTMIRYEKKLFSLFFPQGQISLWIENHPTLGYSTFFGKILTEVSQLFYFLFFLWGNLIFLLLSYRWMIQPNSRNTQNQWSLFFCLWTLAYSLNFALYLVFPVYGPEIQYQTVYQKPIEGLWLASNLHQFIDSNHLSIHDCFPSGHTAISWIMAFCGYRLIGRNVGIFLGIAAFFTTLGTIYLRYHYIVDLLAAIPFTAMLLILFKVFQDLNSSERRSS